MTEEIPTYSRWQNFKDALYGFRPNKAKFTPDMYPDLKGKVAIVTGSNTGLGFQVTKLLYGKNCDVFMVVRNETKGQDARDTLLKEISDSEGSLTLIAGCDYLDLTAIKAVGEDIRKKLNGRPINMIIHNAGLMPPVNTGTSKQGHEAVFQTNVLGPQLLQHFLDPLFLKNDDTALKRIVWVSSAAHLFGYPEYGIRWENPTFENEPVESRPHPMKLYGQSKSANILQAKAWATRNAEKVNEIGCVSVSCYPGNLKTELQRGWGAINQAVGNLLLYNSVYGAYSELYGALSPDLTVADQGAYIIPWGEIGQPRNDIKVGLTTGADLRLWDLVEEKISQFF
ncbi:hypothetical protein KAFR_0A04390 [Kazachstania africana CBS 2517]|uniref:Ketoreductase (KR) domain-containing protein n=1 Tax=Kazachstania africana (strain ATCC 22294 / BCRC 22015 / CBS 2517 / CECT 1963 / NBRC 1671 / NRRL Y-8276) TaxID=1071382 RepID=H2ANC4_KAZAF|nr:hypothetical protein KAFR_0A04390 [Kazachstania africana CBS 2517]CCF55874.1 hypothetical protein KAFR_0A04390 [Kazachstania africana CBS 2517]